MLTEYLREFDASTTDEVLGGLASSPGESWPIRLSACRTLLVRHRKYNEAVVNCYCEALVSDNARVRQTAYFMITSDLYSEIEPGVDCLARIRICASRETDIRLLEASWILRYLCGDNDVVSMASEFGGVLATSFDYWRQKHNTGTYLYSTRLFEFPRFVLRGTSLDWHSHGE